MNGNTHYTNRRLAGDADSTLPVPEYGLHYKKKSRLKNVLDTAFTGGQFLKCIFIVSLAGILLTIGMNAVIDIYGFVRPAKGRQIPVYHNERVSKYLLSYRHIPMNFNTAIIGTSLSANLDAGPYNALGKNKIYNASLMGANISELTPVTRSIVTGGIKNLIICFSPYMTKTSGSKEVDLDKKLYYGAFGSKNLYETYLVALLRLSEILPDKFPKNYIDANGVNHYEKFLKQKDVKKEIARVIEENKNEHLEFDPVALEELTALLQFLSDHNVNYIAYFHPVPVEFYQTKEHDYKVFGETVRRLVGDDNKIIDFNTAEYQWFTTDYSNYFDHGHLNQQGQQVILDILLKKFEARRGAF